jgi:AAA ATPase domain
MVQSQRSYKLSNEGKSKVEEALRLKKLTYYSDKTYEALAELTEPISASVWKRFLQKVNIERKSFQTICKWLDLDETEIIDGISSSEINFYGRDKDLKQLEEWVKDPNCHLIILYGLRGIGKSALVAQLEKQVKNFFRQRIKHQEFSYGDPIDSTLINLLQQLDPQNSCDNLTNQQLKDRFWKHLQQRHLIILKQSDDDRKDKHEEYNQLLREILKTNDKPHQSCILLITSFEKPTEVTGVSERGAAKSLRLEGVGDETGVKIIENKYPRIVNDNDVKFVRELVKKFDGNPLTLKLVASHLNEHYDCNVARFLSPGCSDSYLPDLMKNNIENQLKNLSTEAWKILKILVNDSPMSKTQLHEAFLKEIPSDTDFNRAISLLNRRSILSSNDNNRDGGGILSLHEKIKQVVQNRLTEKT